MNTATNLLESPLAAEHMEQYCRDGFIIVRGIFADEEVAELDAEAKPLFQRTELIDSDNIRCRWQNCVATGIRGQNCSDAEARMNLEFISAVLARSLRIRKSTAVVQPVA